MVCKWSTRWKGLSFAVLQNNSFEIMQDCHSHGKISEFVSEVKYLVHIVQVENEDKLDSKKAKGNVNVHHFSLPKRQWKVREFLTFGWVATRPCTVRYGHAFTHRYLESSIEDYLNDGFQLKETGLRIYIPDELCQCCLWMEKMHLNSVKLLSEWQSILFCQPEDQ